MSWLLPLLALGTARGGQLYVEVADAVFPPDLRSMNWLRTFPDPDGGWYLVHASNGDYGLRLLDEELGLDGSAPMPLTGRTDLIDHGITTCPDGGRLHVSFSQVGDSHTARSFRYDADWNLLSSNVLVEGDPQVHATDMLAHCSQDLSATVWSIRGQVDIRLGRLDDSGALLETLDLEEGVNSTGASMIADPEEGTYIVLGSRWNFAQSLVMRKYDADLELIDMKELELPLQPDQLAYWPQGLLRVGDYFLVAHVVDHEVEGDDNQGGNIWLSFYDTDWELVETAVIVEEHEESYAFMRPSVSRKGDQALVSFDHANGPYLALVTLDLVALGVEEGDSAEVDLEGDSGDTGTPGDTPCGCGAASAVGAAPGLWVLGMVAGLRRRRGQPPAAGSGFGGGGGGPGS